MDYERQKCSRCKMNLTLDKFKKKRDDTYQKMCNECLDKAKINREKNKCEHNREKSQCKECGGASICEHNRKKSSCKECGGASICEHNRRKSSCKECGGASICEHNRVKSQCKECGGASICEHNRVKSSCKECGGAYICEHNRRKNQCKECGGASICEHNRVKSRCKECEGSEICKHNRFKSQCKFCCDDPVRLTIQNMIQASKQYDKKYDRYDPLNFIDYCFVENLLDDYTHCYYQDCKVKLQIMERKDDMATIERLDNSLGHIKSNCVICCWKCNISKKSNKQ